MSKVLLVEDDVPIAEMVAQWLAAERIKVVSVCDGEQAREQMNQGLYDLIVLDWRLPKISGIELCREYRLRGGQTPIIMLTAQAEADHIAEGLDSGADDYLTKPFDPRELVARVRAILRRPIRSNNNELRLGDLVVDTTTHQVARGEQQIKLAPMEYALLEAMMRQPYKVHTPQSLLLRLWDGDVNQQSVYSSINRLRERIDRPGEASLIRTLPGIGYQITDAARDVKCNVD